MTIASLIALLKTAADSAAAALAIRYGPIVALLVLEATDWWADDFWGRARMVGKALCVAAIVATLTFSAKPSTPTPAPSK